MGLSSFERTIDAIRSFDTHLVDILESCDYGCVWILSDVLFVGSLPPSSPAGHVLLPPGPVAVGRIEGLGNLSPFGYQVDHQRRLWKTRKGQRARSIVLSLPHSVEYVYSYVNILMLV